MTISGKISHIEKKEANGGAGSPKEFSKMKK